MTDETPTHINLGPEEAKFMMRVCEAIAAIVLADNLLRQTELDPSSVEWLNARGDTAEYPL